MTDYPGKNSEPDLDWLGRDTWPGQMLIEFYTLREENIVPPGFVENRRTP